MFSNNLKKKIKKNIAIKVSVDLQENSTLFRGNELDVFTSFRIVVFWDYFLSLAINSHKNVFSSCSNLNYHVFKYVFSFIAGRD